MGRGIVGHFFRRRKITSNTAVKVKDKFQRWFEKILSPVLLRTISTAEYSVYNLASNFSWVSVVHLREIYTSFHIFVVYIYNLLIRMKKVFLLKYQLNTRQKLLKSFKKSCELNLIGLLKKHNYKTSQVW